MAYQSLYTGLETDESTRKSNNPYMYVSYLPVGSDYTTPTLTANTPTKLLIPTTIKFANGWELAEVNPSQFAFKFTGTGTRKFRISMSTGMQAGGSNINSYLRMYKGVVGDAGASIHEPGVGVPRKIGTGTDTGALPIEGTFEISTNGYIEVYGEVSSNSTLTFIETAINIMEVN